MVTRMESSNLDFLRANAVLLVLVFHVLGCFGIRHTGPFNLEAMGHLGVLLFFVHTSFVLMLSLERQLIKVGRQRLFAIFMVRRCFRIYPLSILFVVLISFLKLPMTGHPWEMHWVPVGPVDIVSNVLLIQNLTGSKPVLSPLWSLPFEMQMYLLLPGLFLLVRTLKSPWTLVAGCLFVMFIVFVRVRFGHGSLVSYVPCFLSGIVGYKFSAQSQSRWRFIGWPLVLWMSVAIFMVVGTLETGRLICFMVGMTMPHFVEMRNPFLRHTCHLIAKYSYGIYLSHFLCIWLALARLRGLLPAQLQWLIFITILAVVPVLLYHGVEEPLIVLGKKVVEERLSSSARRHTGAGGTDGKVPETALHRPPA